MKGLDKFKKEIQAEVDKVKDANKKKDVQAQANEIIKHITNVCDKEYDDLLNQSHKSFRRMWKFVTEKAKERATQGCAMIKDSTVFGWIDEYVGLDDKKEAEEEAKKEAEQKKRTEEIKAKATTKSTEKSSTKSAPKSSTKSNKPKLTVIRPTKKQSTETQLSIFDLM